MYGIENLSTNKIAEILGLKQRTRVVRLLKLHLRHTFKELTKQNIDELKGIMNLIESN